MSQELEKLRQENKQLKQALYQSQRVSNTWFLLYATVYRMLDATNHINGGVRKLERRLGQVRKLLFETAELGPDPEVAQTIHGQFTPMFREMDSIKDYLSRLTPSARSLLELAYYEDLEKFPTKIIRKLLAAIHLAWEAFRPTVKIAINTELGEDFEIRCFPSQMVHLFSHLIVNACQAIVAKRPRESPVLRIQAYVEEENFVVIFRDRGIGMPEPVMHRIFEPFYTTKVRGVGEGMVLGLGLPICKQIVVAHQGAILVQSEEGVGTKVRVKLPL